MSYEKAHQFQTRCLADEKRPQTFASSGRTAGWEECDKYRPPFCAVLSGRNLGADPHLKKHYYPLYLASKFPLSYLRQDDAAVLPTAQAQGREPMS